MVVLRFLFRSFTPTFSLYKAAIRTKENHTQQLPSQGMENKHVSTKKVPSFEDRSELSDNAAE